MGVLHKNQCALMIIYRWILLRIRNFSDRRCRENQNTHFMFNNFIEKWHHLWENVENDCTVRQVTDDNIIWHVHLACWITVARIQTHRLCNVYCLSMATFYMFVPQYCPSWSVGHWLPGQQHIIQKSNCKQLHHVLWGPLLCCGRERVKYVCNIRLKW